MKINSVRSVITIQYIRLVGTYVRLSYINNYHLHFKGKVNPGYKMSEECPALNKTLRKREYELSLHNLDADVIFAGEKVYKLKAADVSFPVK